MSLLSPLTTLRSSPANTRAIWRRHTVIQQLMRNTSSFTDRDAAVAICRHPKPHTQYCVRMKKLLFRYVEAGLLTSKHDGRNFRFRVNPEKPTLEQQAFLDELEPEFPPFIRASDRPDRMTPDANA